MSRESEFFLKIAIYNSHKDTPVFRWLRQGNIALGSDVAKQFIDNKIPMGKENHYSVYIRLKHNRKDCNDPVIYEKERTQGNVRNAIHDFDDFIQVKFGFSTEDVVKNAIS